MFLLYHDNCQIARCFYHSDSDDLLSKGQTPSRVSASKTAKNGCFARVKWIVVQLPTTLCSTMRALGSSSRLLFAAEGVMLSGKIDMIDSVFWGWLIGDIDDFDAECSVCPHTLGDVVEAATLDKGEAGALVVDPDFLPD